MVGEPGNLGSSEIGNLGNTAGNKALLRRWNYGPFSVRYQKSTPMNLRPRGVDSAPQKPFHRGSLAFPFTAAVLL